MTFWNRKVRLPLVSGSFTLQAERRWERFSVSELTRNTPLKLLLSMCRAALSDRLDLEQIGRGTLAPYFPYAKFVCESGRIQIGILYISAEEDPVAGLRISGEGTRDSISELSQNGVTGPLR
jgi:hypothetical protein